MEVEKDDLIQIKPGRHWGGCILVVQEPKGFGCLAYLSMPGERHVVGRAYLRVKVEDYEPIGAKAIFVMDDE